MFFKKCFHRYGSLGVCRRAVILKQAAFTGTHRHHNSDFKSENFFISFPTFAKTNSAIMAYWLIKSEPFKYSWEKFEKDQQTVWDGVRNYAARLNLRAMKKGDLAFFLP